MTTAPTGRRRPRRTSYRPLSDTHEERDFRVTALPSYASALHPLGASRARYADMLGAGAPDRQSCPGRGVATRVSARIWRQSSHVQSPRNRVVRARVPRERATAAPRQTDAPAQPRGTGAEAVVPAFARVELADEVKKPSGAVRGGAESSAIRRRVDRAALFLASLLPKETLDPGFKVPGGRRELRSSPVLSFFARPQRSCVLALVPPAGTVFRMRRPHSSAMNTECCQPKSNAPVRMTNRMKTTVVAAYPNSDAALGLRR
jgi:hypothetical protein